MLYTIISDSRFEDTRVNNSPGVSSVRNNCEKVHVKDEGPKIIAVDVSAVYDVPFASIVSHCTMTPGSVKQSEALALG
jgi:hypothetical protein